MSIQRGDIESEMFPAAGMHRPPEPEEGNLAWNVTQHMLDSEHGLVRLAAVGAIAGYAFLWKGPKEGFRGYLEAQNQNGAIHYPELSDAPAEEVKTRHLFRAEIGRLVSKSWNNIQQ